MIWDDDETPILTSIELCLCGGMAGIATSGVIVALFGFGDSFARQVAGAAIGMGLVAWGIYKRFF